MDSSFPDIVQCADKTLELSSPKVMGILNLTPDSFYDGGRFVTREGALRRVEEMLAEGADIIDIGAESSRPNAPIISLEEEIDRLMEILESIKKRFDTILSVDTYKPDVMKEAIRIGVNLINDIYALQNPMALDIVANSQVAVCLMHMQGTPKTMYINPSYQQIIVEIGNFLQQRANACLEKGIPKSRILLDPGFGFGKSKDHNLILLKNLSQLKQIGFPLLVGLSRKASIGEILSLPASERLYGSLAAHVVAAVQGASIIRTHDIKPTVEALKITEAVLAQETLEWQ